MRAGEMVKRGVSSKADRLENETFVKKGSAAQNWPIPNSGLDVLNALDAWSLPLSPHGPGGSQARNRNKMRALNRYYRWA